MDAVVREQLQIIDDRLMRAERTWGRNVVVHDLPTNLAMPGLDKRDAQRIVYTAIIRSLTKRGFEIRLLLEENQSSLYVVWVTDLDTEEIQAMNQLVKSVRITRDKLPEFMGDAHLASGRAPKDGKTDTEEVSSARPAARKHPVESTNPTADSNTASTGTAESAPLHPSSVPDR